MAASKVRKRRQGIGGNERGRDTNPKHGGSWSSGDDPFDATIDGDGESSSIFGEQILWPPHLLLAVATMCVYSPVIFRSTGFVWDDVIFKDARQFNPGSTPGATSITYLIDAARGLRDVWFSTRWSQEIHYWPVTYTSLWIERVILHPLLRRILWFFGSPPASRIALLGPDDPRGYHFTNVLLHVGNAFLVRTCARRMGASESASWGAAIWFAINPMNVESVAWIIERKDVLSGWFYLLAFRYHPNTRAYTGGDRANATMNGELGVSLLFYVIALLSKTIAVSLPVALLVVPCVLHGKVTRRHITLTIPLFVAGILLSLNDMRLANKYEPYDLGLSFVERVALCARSLAFYFGKWTWTGVQSPVYPRWDVEGGRIRQDLFSIGREGGGNGEWFLPFAAVISGSLALFTLSWFKLGGDSRIDTSVRNNATNTERGRENLRSRSNHTKLPAANSGRKNDSSSRGNNGIAYRIPFGAWFYFATTLSPVVGLFVDFGYMNYSFVADRFQYLASIGLMVASSVGLASFLEQLNCNPKREFKETKTHRLLLQRLICLAIVAYSFVMARKSHLQSKIYVNNEAFYQHAATTNPLAKNMVFNLGNSLMDQKRDEEAIQQFSKAIELAPDDVTLRTNFGVTLTRMGRLTEAMEHLERGIGADPTHAKAHSAMGNAMSDTKRHADAAMYFERAIELDDTNPIYWGNLGNERARLGMAREAIGPYLEAVRRDGHYTKARINLSSVYSALGMRDEALTQLRTVLGYEPGSVLAKDRLEAIG